MELTSPHNPALQSLRRAIETGKTLDDGTVAAEGPHLLREALRDGFWQIRRIFCSEGTAGTHQALIDEAVRRSIAVDKVAPRAFRAVSGLEQSQGVITVLKPREFSWEQVLSSPGPAVILDGIQDPGNAGTIIRSTEAFGGGSVILTEDSARISNGKLLRAAAGSLFRLPFIENAKRTEVIDRLRQASRRLLVLSSQGDKNCEADIFVQPFALAVGSEGKGISPLLQKAGEGLCIPTHRVESLNAAVACSVALFAAMQFTNGRKP